MEPVENTGTIRFQIPVGAERPSTHAADREASRHEAAKCCR